jgi:DNA repair protein RadC
VTKRLREAGELLGIPVLDNLIIGIDHHFSFRESGQMEP